MPRTKAVKQSKRGRKPVPDVENMRRVWHRYHTDTLRALTQLKVEIRSQLPYFMNRYVDDPSIITALILKAKRDMDAGNFRVQDYFGTIDPSSYPGQVKADEEDNVEDNV